MKTNKSPILPLVPSPDDKAGMSRYMQSVNQFLQDLSLNARSDLDTVSSSVASMVDTIYPVGVYYTQYPDAESNTLATAFPSAQEPGSLFPGTTWVEQFSDEGVFFRTRGDPYSEGQDHKRTTGLQTDQIQGHNHNLDINNVSYATGDTLIGTAVAGTPNQTQKAFQAKSIRTDGTNGTPSVGKETRPLNRLFKVWKRTA